MMIKSNARSGIMQGCLVLHPHSATQTRPHQRRRLHAICPRPHADLARSRGGEGDLRPLPAVALWLVPEPQGRVAATARWPLRPGVEAEPGGGVVSAEVVEPHLGTRVGSSEGGRYDMIVHD